MDDINEGEVKVEENEVKIEITEEVEDDSELMCCVISVQLYVRVPSLSRDARR